MSVPPAPPLLLASTSPRRREILEQFRIPFDVVAPAYEENEGDPVAHALGKARSMLEHADGRPVLGCDTEVICGGRVYGKAETAQQAEEMLESLAGKTHEVVSGLALITPAWEEVHQEVTRVDLPSPRRTRSRPLRREPGMGGTRGRLRDPGARRLPRRADRRRLSERGRPPGRSARAAPRRALSGGLWRWITCLLDR